MYSIAQLVRCSHAQRVILFDEDDNIFRGSGEDLTCSLRDGPHGALKITAPSGLGHDVDIVEINGHPAGFWCPRTEVCARCHAAVRIMERQALIAKRSDFRTEERGVGDEGVSTCSSMRSET